MEKATLSVSKFVLKEALSYVKSAIAEEVALQLGIQRDHAFIRDEFEMMQAFLMAAYEESDEHKLVKIWVKQVREVSYDVEDYLQDFAIRLGRQPWWRIRLRKFLDTHHVAKKMKGLREKVEDVSQRNKRYRLIMRSGPNPAAAATPAPAALQWSNAGATAFGGIEEAKEGKHEADLSDLIRRDDKSLQVISVWGGSSVLDQTSIIRGAYEDMKRKNKFECYAWIWIMHPFNPAEFLRSTLSAFFFSAAEAENDTAEEVTLRTRVLEMEEKKELGDLVREFNNYVRHKSYLIVLNDLSTFEEWEWIKSNFSNDEKGCRILVSTEQREVAELCLSGEAPVVQLKLKQSPSDKDIYAFCDKGYTDKSLLMLQDEAIKRIINDTDDQQLKVISICGMDDFGTSLAEDVFNSLKRNKDGVYINQESCAEFDKCILINLVKNPSHAQDLLSHITMEMTKDDEKGAVDGEISSADPLSLASVLGSNKYLIALVGLTRNDAAWENFWQNLPKETTARSRIIVTTRESDIANHCVKNAKSYMMLEHYPQGNAWKFTEKGSQGSRSDSTTSGSNNNTIGGQGNAYTEPLFQGRDEDAKEIIDLISDQGENQVKLIAIHGMGGVGKTSLAKHVYQRQTFKNGVTFNKRAFLTMSHPFNADDFKSQLTKQLENDVSAEDKKKDSVQTRGGLHLFVESRGKKDGASLSSSNLPGLLEENVCLIVLDDLPSTTSEATMETIKTDLIDSMKNKASRIIVTTRERKIAERLAAAGKGAAAEEGKGCIELDKLEEKYAWQLFTEKVFKEKMEEKEFKVKHSELAQEAALIMKKCDGLPLAICTLGGFLAEQQKTHSVWRNLNRHIRDELDMNPELGMIKTVLSKSFDGLPHELKCCFLYISIFPEDHHTSRRRLVRRWIAEGYSSEGHSESEEEIADRYFTQLISRSMLEPSKKSIRSRKEPDSCQVHDMMREISILRSTEENLVLRLEPCSSSSMQGKPRHLVVSNWNGGQSQFERIVDPSGIRSVTVFGKWHAFILSEKMRFLRVLDLEDTSGLVQHHLEHIGEFLHMKYLSLRGCRGIIYLPDSIGNLKQLQTLDITGTSIIKLPKTIIKLRKLQYLRAWAKYQQQSYDLSESCAACCAPEIMGDVLKSSGNYFRSDVCNFCCCLMFPAYAQKLTAPGVAVPRGVVRRLKALHTLGAVNIAADKAIVQDIRRLIRLRKLAVTNVDKKNCQDLCSALNCLINLESLYVRSSEGQQSNLEKPLYEPPASLQSLKLIGANLFNLVNWEAKAKVMNLVKLKLKHTNISKSDASTTMKHLGELPKLNTLRLLRDSFSGTEPELKFLAGAEVFPSLAVLEVDRIGRLKKVEFQKDSASKLELLQYRGLPNGNTTLFSGINFLQNLKEFSLHQNDYNNDNLKKNIEVQLQGREKPNNKKPVLKMF